jgi:hypothetical protein
MNIQLEEEIKSSFTLRGYNILSNFSKFIPYFKWVAGTLFAMGLFQTVVSGEVSKFIMWTSIIIWIPGLIFVFIGAFFHISVGIKIRKLSKKYSLKESEITDYLDQIYKK